MTTRWRKLSRKIPPFLWLAGAILISLTGNSIASRLNTLERGDDAQRQVIDQLAVNQEALQQAAPDITVQTPEEIAEEVAEETGTDPEAIGPSPTGPQGERGEAGPIGPIGPVGPVGPGPTDEQIAEAVAQYCAEGRCRGEDGEDGDAPTPAQLIAAVTAYCAVNECVGPQGEVGPAGRPPTPDEVLLAVGAYCESNDGCRGPAGETGNRGETGAQGPPGLQGEPGPIGMTGADGPPPTQEQVNAAVAAYCSVNNCTGPQGPAGPAGVDAREVIGGVATCTMTDIQPNTDLTVECPVTIFYAG